MRVCMCVCICIYIYTMYVYIRRYIDIVYLCSCLHTYRHTQTDRQTEGERVFDMYGLRA